MFIWCRRPNVTRSLISLQLTLDRGSIRAHTASACQGESRPPPRPLNREPRKIQWGRSEKPHYTGGFDRQPGTMTRVFFPAIGSESEGAQPNGLISGEPSRVAVVTNRDSTSHCCRRIRSSL
ncbi:hypothetical protein VTK26DRAFT_1845 [Humicola hyalothermophila]